MDPRVVLVTGGASGIGAAVSAELAAHGWRVHAASRNVAPADDGPEGVTRVRCDVRDPDELRATVDAIVARWGRLDALVNSAGVAATGAFESQPVALLEEVVRINVLGALHACRAAMPALRATRGGIVNIGSTLADHPRPETVAYAASKGALDSMTKALAVEFGPHGVRVNCVRPSLVRTGLMRKAGVPDEAFEAIVRARAAAYPLRRVGEPSDVAHMVRFLLSEESGWTTGAVIDVDGGHAASG